MAQVASNPLVVLHHFRPNSQASSQTQNSLVFKLSANQLNKPRRFQTITACQKSNSKENLPVESAETESTKSSTSSSTTTEQFPELLPNKSTNKQIAVVSVVAAFALFFSSRLDFGVSLKDLAAVALPYEEALSNGKPTVVEFYADWCEVCRELAPDIYKVEQQYKDRVNFVMLNVDNTKWEQELDEFGVEGIPHFAFLDKEGNEEGNVVGRLPSQYLQENVDALSRGEASIPHARVVGQFSSAESRKVKQVGLRYTGKLITMHLLPSY